MGLSGDTRAVTVQVGAVILFGFLVVALSVYQATAVPAQNERVEFTHSQEVQNQLQDLRNAVLGTAASGSGLPASITLGTRYPDRIFFVNPPPATGTLRTVPLGNRSIRVENTEAVANETRDYWSGTKRFETKGLVYDPDYNVYGGAPTTVYENTVLVNDFRNAQVPQTGQILVDGHQITLLTLNGSVYESGSGSASIDPEAVSAPYRSVTVRDNGTKPVLRLPTRLSNSTWTKLLSDEAAVQKWETNEARNVVNITLARGRYDLRMARVGVGTQINRSAHDAKYLTIVDGEGTNSVTVEARDRFNNPVAGVSVNASSGGSNLVNTSLETGDDGRATFTYTGFTKKKIPLQLQSAGASPTAAEQVTAEFSNAGGGGGAGGGGTGSINPNASGAVVLQDEVFDDPNQCGGDSCRVTVTLNNTGSSQRTIDEIRYNFYAVDTRSSNTRTPPKSVQLNSQKLVMRGPYKDPGSMTLPSGKTTVGMCFYEDNSLSTPFDINSGDFYILSIRYDNGDLATYFIPPTDGTPSTVDYGCGGGGGNTGGGGSSGQVQNDITYQGSEGTTGSGSGLAFDIENTGSSFARIETVSINSQIKNGNRIYDDTDYEIKITGGDKDGYADDKTSASNAYTADGSSVNIPGNAVLSTSGGGTTARVKIGDFGKVTGNSLNAQSFNGWNRVQSSDPWDVKVVFQLQNRGDVTYYFQST